MTKDERKELSKVISAQDPAKVKLHAPPDAGVLVREEFGHELDSVHIATFMNPFLVFGIGK